MATIKDRNSAELSWHNHLLQCAVCVIALGLATHALRSSSFPASSRMSWIVFFTLLISLMAAKTIRSYKTLRSYKQ